MHLIKYHRKSIHIYQFSQPEGMYVRLLSPRKSHLGATYVKSSKVAVTITHHPAWYQGPMHITLLYKQCLYMGIWSLTLSSPSFTLDNTANKTTAIMYL